MRLQRRVESDPLAAFSSSPFGLLTTADSWRIRAKAEPLFLEAGKWPTTHSVRQREQISHPQTHRCRASAGTIHCLAQFF